METKLPFLLERPDTRSGGDDALHIKSESVILCIHPGLAIFKWNFAYGADSASAAHAVSEHQVKTKNYTGSILACCVTVVTFCVFGQEKL